MDEPYRIEVLHIVNPHVIFIESQSEKNEPVIEQVGLYGVLPVNKTIDIDGEIQVERCENWPIAANTILREVLSENHRRIYFVPIEANERSTIFDQNIYKFGDIIIKSRKTISVTEHLLDTAVAVQDEQTFLQKLTSGSLKLKLNTARTEEVLTAIKKYYKKSKVDHNWQETLDKQTVHHQKKKITAELTVENLKLFEKTSAPMRDISKVIAMKERDLELCREADMVSVGCGTRRQSRTNSNTPTSINNDKNSPRNILSNVKLMLDTHGRKSDISDNNVVCKTTEPENIQHSTPKQVLENETRNNENVKTRDTAMFGKTYKQNVNKKYEGGNSSPMKPNVRHIVYCPDMEMSPNNIKDLIPIVVAEDSEKNFVSNVEDSTDNMIKPSEVNSLDDQGNIKIDDDRSKGDDFWAKTDDNCNKNYVRNKNDEIGQAISESNVRNSKDVNKNTTKTGINIPYLQEKLQALRKSQREANDSISSKSDLSLDQIDCSPNNSKNNVRKTDESHLVSTPIIKNNLNYESEEIVKNPENKNTKSTHTKNSFLQTRLQLLKNQQKRSVTSAPTSDTCVNDSSVTEESKAKAATEVKPKLTRVEPNLTEVESNLTKVEPSLTKREPDISRSNLARVETLNKVERNVNPFKNLESSKSVFVDKLVSPTLMVHTKNDNLILPKCELREIPFKSDIRMMLKNMHVQKPKRLQTVTWSYILRGHSMFIIGPEGNGKTLGYVPAVCNLISDARTQFEGVGPICIIVCATALSVSQIESLCKRFLSVEEKIVSFYPGIDTTKVITDLLNGCHLLICTATALVNLLETDFGVDLRRLGVLVFEDCERLSQVYLSEIHKITQNVNLMLKNRADKALKVQYVVVSRQWCDFMMPLAKKAPDTVIAIGASQECVLYSKTHTSVNIVNSDDKKMDSVLEFLEQIDFSKRTVIVCREDEEVDNLASALKEMRYTVFSCNSTMTLHDLYKLSEAWNSYKEPISGPVLVCCDGNLTHLNITNANYLVHYSLPLLFSMFCHRFFVLNENYASIFAPEKTDVKIKILMDKTNVEQLPKIMHFIKRCTNQDLTNLDDVLQEVMKKKDLKKAKILTPVCDNLLTLGDCVDVWNCTGRHTVFEKFDECKDWMPKNGVITFKIPHFDSAVTYSARVLSKVTKSDTVKLPNNLNTLALKMGRYYSKEKNRKLHGTPKVGDICAVASQQSLYERCLVMKVIPTEKKNNYHVLINLTDKEQMTIVSDVELYYLPEDLKAIETYVVKVRLANVQPKDKDVTFSVAAKEHLQKLTEYDRESGLYMRGKVAMTLGNCIYVDTAEACVDLSTMGETVVKRDFKKELLDRHAEPNPQHIVKLKKLTGISDEDAEEIKPTPKMKNNPKWAHLDKDDFSTVIVSTIIDPNTIFLRHTKFQKLIVSLQKDIEAYVEKAPEIDKNEIYVGNIVLAEFPDDKTYERSRIDEVTDKKVKCFFVDNGDFRQVAVDKLRPIPENMLHRIPFQSIECRLIGVKPPGSSDWPEFSTSWLDDTCFEDKEGRTKQLYVKYFTKEPAMVTGGHKYGVVAIDTSSDQDVNINNMMIELNLAKEIEEEMKFIDEPFDLSSFKATDSSSEDNFNNDSNYEADKEKSTIKDLMPVLRNENYESDTTNNIPMHVLYGKPIRSVPLVNSDSDSDISDKWDVNVDKDMLGFFGQPSKANITEPKNTTYEKTTKSTADSRSEKSNLSKVNTNASNINAEIRKLDKNDDSKDRVVIPSGSNSDNSSSLPTLSSKQINQGVLNKSLDSDDIEIGEDRNKALDVFARNIIKNNSHEKTFNDKSEKQKVVSKNETLDSDDLSSVANDFQIIEGIVQNEAKDSSRKPKIVWRQNKNTVSLKIILIGVEEYVLEIKDRQIKFETWHSDTQYGFEFELYGAVLPQKCLHSNKGQYIHVSLTKMLPRNWLNLTKDFSVKKWIVYDVDAIDFSTDDDDDVNDDAQKVIKYNHENVDSASEDEEFVDDLTFTYKRH